MFLLTLERWVKCICMSYPAHCSLCEGIVSSSSSRWQAALTVERLWLENKDRKRSADDPTIIKNFFAISNLIQHQQSRQRELQLTLTFIIKFGISSF